MRAHQDVAQLRVGIRANISALYTYWRSVAPNEVASVAGQMGRDAAESASILIRALLFIANVDGKLSEGTVNKMATLWRNAPTGAASNAIQFLQGEHEEWKLVDFTTIGQLSAALSLIKDGKSPYPEVSDKRPVAKAALRLLRKVMVRLTAAIVPGNVTLDDVRDLLEFQAQFNAMVEAVMPTTTVPSTIADAEEASV
jgi:hypothetical protein